MTLLLVDALLVVLLLFGIKTVRDFHEKMQEYAQVKNELNGLMRQVQASMKNAQSLVSTLQSSIQFAAKNITPHLPKAGSLKDDLAFLIEHGETLADRLENLSRHIKQTQISPQQLVKNVEEQSYTPSIPMHSESRRSSDPNIQVEHHGFFTKTKRLG